MNELLKIPMTELIKDFREMPGESHAQRFCFVLGAGASISSGIKSGQQLVAIWEEYLKSRYGEAHEAWKQKHNITPENRASFYSKYYERRFPDPNRGYSFMEREMEKASPSGGYAALAYLLCRNESRSNLVLTTNFDHLTEDAVSRQQGVLPLVVGHESLAHYVSYYVKEGIRRPIIVKIHRDLLMEPKNTEDEIETLDPRWEEPLDLVFTNYHPVFIGYAGNDNSLMDYLIGNSDKFKRNAWKLPYWTLYGNEALRGKAKAFMEAAGGFVVPGCDFDELMILLGDELGFKLKTADEVAEAARKEHEEIAKIINEVLTKKTRSEAAKSAPVKNQASAEDRPDAEESAGPTAPSAAEPARLNDAIGRITGDTDPASRSARFRQAILAHNSGKYAEAEKMMRALLAEDPDNAVYHRNLGVTLYEMRLCNEAEAEHRRALELDPDKAASHRELGLTLHVMKRYDEAEAEKRRALELDPDNAEYHYSLGVTLHAMKRYDEAEAETRRALELGPDNAFYHQQLGVTLYEMKRYDEAEAEHRRALELDPNKAASHRELGLTLHVMKRYNEAEAEYRRALELDPDNALYHNDLGVTLHAMKRYDEAEAEKRRAVELDPDNAKYYDSLAITLRANGKYQEARQAEKKAAELRKQQGK